MIGVVVICFPNRDPLYGQLKLTLGFFSALVNFNCFSHDYFGSILFFYFSEDFIKVFDAKFTLLSILCTEILPSSIFYYLLVCGLNMFVGVVPLTLSLLPREARGFGNWLRSSSLVILGMILVTEDLADILLPLFLLFFPILTLVRPLLRPSAYNF